MTYNHMPEGRARLPIAVRARVFLTTHSACFVGALCSVQCAGLCGCGEGLNLAYA